MVSSEVNGILSSFNERQRHRITCSCLQHRTRQYVGCTINHYILRIGSSISTIAFNMVNCSTSNVCNYTTQPFPYVVNARYIFRKIFVKCFHKCRMTGGIFISLLLGVNSSKYNAEAQKHYQSMTVTVTLLLFDLDIRYGTCCKGTRGSQPDRLHTSSVLHFQDISSFYHSNQ